MKSLTEYILEVKNKYVLTWYKEGIGSGHTFISNPNDLSSVKDALYWDLTVLDSTTNASEVSDLIAWYNKGDEPHGYWAHVLYNSENPNKADKNANILKGRKLEELKRKRK